MLRCEECERAEDSKAVGWRGLLNGEPGVDEFDYVSIFCPECAERECGPRRPRDSQVA